MKKIIVSSRLLALGSVFVFLFAIDAASLVQATCSGSCAVNVTASVAQSVTCSTDVTTTDFGALTSGSITRAASNASTTVTTNDGNGATLNVNDANHGLATSSPSYTIPSVTATLSAGTEGYGIEATTTAGGSGGTLNIPALYNATSNLVGNLNTTTTLIASSTSAITGKLVKVTHWAAISGSTQAASYTDTITYSCTGN